MARKEAPTLDQVFKALSDPVRMAVVADLIESDNQEKACGTFQHTLTKATFSHHLQILNEAGLIQTRQEGTRKMISLRTKELNQLYPGFLQFLKTQMKRR